MVLILISTKNLIPSTGFDKYEGWAAIDLRGFGLSCYEYTVFETNGNKINERELSPIYKIH